MDGVLGVQMDEQGGNGIGQRQHSPVMTGILQGARKWVT